VYGLLRGIFGQGEKARPDGIEANTERERRRNLGQKEPQPFGREQEKATNFVALAFQPLAGMLRRSLLVIDLFLFYVNHTPVNRCALNPWKS